MNDSERHYAKWKKPDREKEILHGFTYMWNLDKQVKLIETESRGKENKERLVKIYKLLVIKSENPVEQGDCNWQQCIT